MNLYFYASKIITPLILPSNFFIFALIIFFYLGILKKKERFKRIFSIFFILFSLISLLPLGENLIYYVLEKNYKNSKLPKNIDYIFVPAGNPKRIVRAIEIKSQYLPLKVKIIYSSGNPALDKKKGNDEESPFVQTILKNSIIDEKDIIFLPDARNTIENFKQLSRYLGKDRKKNILLVTSAFHMKRSLIIAKNNKININGFPSDFYTRNNYFSLVNFYQNINIQRNLYYFNIFFKEIVGIFVVKIIF
jgi:uncharacterized SAM-binding protein YcdF (DUF218 family)